MWYLNSTCCRGFTKFGIKVLLRLQVLVYLRTLHLKFRKAWTKIEVVLSLPCWLSQLNWDSQKGRLRTTSILVGAFWNFKLKVLKYSKNCSLYNILIPWCLKNPESPNVGARDFMRSTNDQSISRIFLSNFWHVFAIWHNCVAVLKIAKRLCLQP